jgi:dihydroorotate dehydrogenase (NAD+) catalytic subunit
MSKLSVKFINQTLSSPLVLASGILGTKAKLLARVAATGIGAVTTKSCGLEPRCGHENPTILAWEHGLLNAVGLSNPGVEKEVEEILELRQLLDEQKLKTKIIASFFGFTLEEFVKVAKKIIKAKPDFLEMNISCPNVASEAGRSFSASSKDTYAVTRAVKKLIGNIPLIVKLSPNVTDIVEIAQAAENAGADGICAVNTLFGMAIDIESGRPILTNKMGGVSGPGIKPVAVRCVYQISQKVKIPVIGLGGVSNGHDAIEMMMAGATAVGVGSAVYQHGIEVFDKINQQMVGYLQRHKLKSLRQIKGKAWV